MVYEHLILDVKLASRPPFTRKANKCTGDVSDCDALTLDLQVAADLSARPFEGKWHCGKQVVFVEKLNPSPTFDQFAPDTPSETVLPRCKKKNRGLCFPGLHPKIGVGCQD